MHRRKRGDLFFSSKRAVGRHRADLAGFFYPCVGMEKK